MQHAPGSCLHEPGVHIRHEPAVHIDTNQLHIHTRTINFTYTKTSSTPLTRTISIIELMWNNLLNIFDGWPYWLQDLSLVVLAILFGLIIIVVITRLVQHF